MARDPSGFESAVAAHRQTEGAVEGHSNSDQGQTVLPLLYYDDAE